MHVHASLAKGDGDYEIAFFQMAAHETQNELILKASVMNDCKFRISHLPVFLQATNLSFGD